MNCLIYKLMSYILFEILLKMLKQENRGYHIFIQDISFFLHDTDENYFKYTTRIM